MKILNKISIATAVISLSFYLPLKAQFQLPNPSFENWGTGWNSMGQDPTSWHSSNVSQSGASATMGGVDNNGHTGKCLYLESKWVGAMGVGSDAPAYCTLGSPWQAVSGLSVSSGTGGTTGGIDFTYRPDTMAVWIKRAYSTAENARLVIYLWKDDFVGDRYRSKAGNCENYMGTKTNEESDIRNRGCHTTTSGTRIADGEYVISSQITGWTQIKVPITYYNSTVPTKLNVILSASNYPSSSSDVNAGAKLWADDLSLIYSSKIHQLRFNDRPYSAFNPDILEYTYSLGQGVTQIPTIAAFRSGRQLSGAEISITNGVVDVSPTIITVTAQDGSSSTTTYRINFVTAQSTYSRLDGISINGAPLANFNTYITNYNVSLPYGTTACPTISAQKAEDAQTINITNCTNLNGGTGSATIRVTAQNEAYSTTYTLNFSVAQLNDNTLQNILINGVGIPNFRPTNNNYIVELPLGTTQAPTITPVSAYPDGEQTILPTNNGLSGQSTIVVSSPASQQRTYRISFVISASSYAFLNDIKVGGVSLQNFNAETLNYSYVLPRGTTTLPAITWVTGEQNQTVTKIENGVNGETRLTVQAQNGNTVIYRINFSVERSENSLLNNIFIGGQSIENFDPDTLIYNIELPSGTTALPAITWQEGDYAQNVRLTTNGLNGAATIRVTAENTAFVTIYTLNFSVTLSANSQLNAILIDGDTVNGFSPEILNYNYILPANAVQCPDIEVIKATAGQVIFITKPALTGIATIKVASETADGGENIYTINFQFELSADNLLDYIKLDGALIAGFDSQTTDYNVVLPYGSVAPAVEYLAHDNTARVFVIDNGLNGIKIKVTAENGATRTYSINYNITPTNNVDLANIEIFDNATQNFVSIENFDAQTINYTYNLAWRTSNVPAINPVAAESGQVITIFYDVVNATTEIKVVAPNGIDEKSYFIYFPAAKSDVKTLSSITINGAEIADFTPLTPFHPNLLTYNIPLPYGTTQTPEVAFEKGKVNNQIVYEEIVEVTAGSFGEPYLLKVTAENGATQTYTLNFSVDMSSKIGQNYLNNILVDDVPVADFNSNTLEYSVVLPYGTTEMPELVFVKKYPEQTIAYDAAGIYGTAKIKVFSNISGVATTEYKINFSVSDVPTTTLTNISFTNMQSGFNLNFDARIKTYIVPVTDLPVASYTFDNTKYFDDVIFSNHKKYEIKISDQTDDSDFNTYTFWFYYVEDIIPNASFENWENAAKTGRKPTGWNAPNDANSRVGGGATTNRSELISQSGNASNGSSSVYLNGGIYSSSTTQDFPSLITLGSFFDQSTTFLGINTWALGSSSGVNGGRDFKNTPDEVKMDYIYDRQGTYDDRHMKFVFQLWNTGTDYSGTQNVSNFTYEDYSSRGSWYTMTRAVTYSGNNLYPQRMNIIINANKSENTADLYPTVRDRGKLTVDNVRLCYNSTLSNLFVGATAVAGFNGANNLSYYYADVPAETMAKPVITFANAVPDQEVRITVSDENPGNRQRTATVLSKAEDNETFTEYTIIINRPAATSNLLADIKIGGVSVASFDANTLTYNVSVPNGTRFAPDVAAVKGEGHQNISYSFENKKVLINVAAENGAAQTYIVNFVEQTSDDATLANLEVDGYEINFDAQTTEYQVILPAETKNIPQIIFTKQTDGQKVILTTSSANGTSVVRATAQDGVNFTDYKINFSTENVASSHLLSEIALGNAPIGSFAQTTFEYSVNRGKLVFAKEFTQDTINVVYFADSVKCFIGENIYKIVFENENNANAYLDNIAVNLSFIDNYVQNQFNYSVEWDNDVLPDIAAVSGANGQTITCVWGESSITISVTAPNGIAQNDYTINFVPSVLSNNSLLADILFDGESLAEFEPTGFIYNIELLEETTQIPVIQAVKGEQHQTLNLTANGINADNTIVVTAQDGTQSTYTIHFTVALSNNALLSEILIGGVLIDDFDSHTFSYSHTFPYGTTELPAIDFTKAHPRSTTAVVPSGVRGNYIINVTSESGLVQNQYVIAFDVALSPNAYLQNILQNEVEIAGFFPEILEYRVEVACGTENVPTITFVQGDENQIVAPTPAATLNDTTYLLVTAENGLNQNTYKISFFVRPSSNVLLENIVVGSENLADFEAEQFDYSIVLPYGTTVFPVISATAQGSADCSEIEIEQTENAATINVTSQDGSVNTYNIAFSIALSDNSSLTEISLGGVLLPNYNSDTLFYEIIYPIGTPESALLGVDDVSFIQGDENQLVQVSAEDNRIVIVVTAPDGVSQRVYVIEQIILKSSNALLKDILINGKSIDGFEPTTFDYTYTLPFGASQIPEFEGVKQEESQTLLNSENNVGVKSYIYITAEDGTEEVYSILFEPSKDNPGEVPTKDDVCFSYYADGVFKASSRKNNVSIVIFDPAGRLVYRAEVPVADPNDEFCPNGRNTSEIGAMFRTSKRGQVYIYTFLYNKKQKIKDANGKFLY